MKLYNGIAINWLMVVYVIYNLCKDASISIGLAVMSVQLYQFIKY